MNTSDAGTLVSRILGDEIAPKEMNEAVSVLEQSPDLQRDLANEIYVDTFLAEVLGDLRPSEDLTERTLALVAASEGSGRAEVAGRAERKRSVRRARISTAGRRRVRRRMWLAVAACAAISVTAHLINLQRSRSTHDSLVARIASIRERVLVERGGERIEAYPNMDLFVGDEVRTEANGAASVRYANEQSTIEILSDTEVVLFDEEGAKRIDLTRGALVCSVAAQPSDKEMVIRTPRARAEVKGTVFTLEDDGTATRLSVTEGKVLLVRSSDGASALVTAGQSSAVRGELPLMVTSAGGQRGDGEIIFEDDFDEGLANWRLVIGEMLFDEPVPAADAGRYLQMRRVERDGKMTSCVALDSSTISGEKLLGLRSALPIDEDAWAVELDALVEQKGKVPRLGVAHVSHDPASRGSAVLALIDAEQIRQTEGWMHVRMEFIWSTDASGRRLSLSWRQFLNGAPDGMTSGGAGPSGSSRSSFVIETSNMTFLIDRVVVRRIASPQLKGGR